MRQQKQIHYPISYFLIILTFLSACARTVNENAVTEDSSQVVQGDALVQDEPSIEETEGNSPSEGIIDVDKPLNDFLTGNFALFWDQEEDVEPVKLADSYLEGGIGWPGGTVLFFNTNHEVFGNATGFDMDSHRFKGEYKIDSEKKDQSESVYKIFLSGERIDYIEGEVDAHRNQLSNQELQLFFKDGKVFLSGFSMLEGSEKRSATLQGLLKKELDLARVSHLKMDSTLNDFLAK